MIKKFNFLFLRLFLIGNIKHAPGTVSSFVTCIIFLILINFFEMITIFFFTVVVFLYALIAINNSYKSFDSKDPQDIVIDEFIGQMLPLLAIPIYETLYPAPILLYCILAFLLFRFFDILKPFPISYIDKNTEGSLGIMMDDVVAGFFSALVLIIGFYFFGG